MTLVLPPAWPRTTEQLPGHVEPKRGDDWPEDPLLYLPRLEDLLPKNCPALRELIVRHDEISGAAVESGC